MKLYKYMACSHYTIKNLANNQFYLAAVKEFNDPFEFSYSVPDVSHQTMEDVERDILDNIIPSLETYTFSEDAAEIASNTIEKLRKLIAVKDADTLIKYQRIRSRETERSVSAYLNGIGVSCFTQNPVSPHMWMYYGDGLKGICVEFEFPESIDFAAVDYVKPEAIIELDLIRLKVEDYKKQLERIVLTKHVRSKAESEYRLIVNTAMFGSIYPYAPEWVKGIIFGGDINEQDEALIKKLFSDKSAYPDIKYHYAQRKGFSYDLEIVTSKE